MLKKLSLVLTMLFLSVTGLAQSSDAKPAEAAPQRLLGLVNEYTIKPGMMTAYLQWAEKEAIPLYHKAGIKEAYFFTNIYDSAERSIVTFIEVHPSFAAIKARNEAFTRNNSQEARAAWSAKAPEFIESTRAYIVEGLPEISWRNPNLKKASLYYVVTERYIAPFRGRDYEAYLKNDYLPLVKKANGNGITVTRLRYGGEMGHYYVFSGVDDLTELDQPSKITAAAGGQDAVQKMMQKLIGVVQRSESRILRLRTELSIIPEPARAAK